MYRMVKQTINCDDPYINEKIIGNKIALELFSMIKDLLKEDNSLENILK